MVSDRVCARASDCGKRGPRFGFVQRSANLPGGPLLLDLDLLFLAGAAFLELRAWASSRREAASAAGAAMSASSMAAAMIE
jgi:hypothetical protein